MIGNVFKRFRRNGEKEEKTKPALSEKAAAAREACIDDVIKNTGWTRDAASAHVDDARARLGLRFFEYRKCRMWEIPVEKQQTAYEQYLEKKQQEKKNKETEKRAALKRQELRSEAGDAEEIFRYLTEKNGICTETGFDDVIRLTGEELLPDLDVDREDFEKFKKRFEDHKKTDNTADSFLRMYIDWLFFCKDSGYDMDDYFDYEFFEKDAAARSEFAGANFRDNLRKYLNKETGMLSDKMRFLKTFDRFIERLWTDPCECTDEEFEAFFRSSPVIFAKMPGGSGGDSVIRIDTADRSPKELLEDLRSKKCIAEAAIVQHRDLAGFNAGSVNTIRTVTINDKTDRTIIAGAAVRFGREGGFMDNFHQGGMCALVDPETGIIISDACDRNGNRYEKHPDSGKQFRGFRIPHWEEIVKKSKAAAEICGDSNRIVGWDLAVMENGSVDIIEGNSRPGFDILQVPDMNGRKEEYKEYVEGLITEEQMNDLKTGYWRKKNYKL